MIFSVKSLDHAKALYLFLLVFLGISLQGCASNSSSLLPNQDKSDVEFTSRSVVYEYPAPMVFRAAQKAARDLDMEFTLTDAKKFYFIAEKGYTMLDGEFIGVYLDAKDAFSVEVKVRSKPKISSNMLAKNHIDDIHYGIEKQLTLQKNSPQELWTKESTQLYPYPEVKSRKIANVPPHTGVQSVFKEGSWYFITYGTKRGWIQTRRVTADKPETPAVASATGKSVPDARRYRLTISAVPADSLIKIMNIASRYRPGIELSPGRYDILVQRQGYQTVRRWVTLQDRDVTLDISLPSMVGSTPEAIGMTRKRTALIIGNAAYKRSPLKNPVNDATDMAGTLTRLGFDVTLLRNAEHRQMEDAIESFSRKLRRGGVGLFYFAGHGVAVSGQNYLIPLHSEIETAADVKYQAVHAGWILERMEDAENDLNVVMLDACRDNPFTRGSRSSQRGLAFMQAARGSLITYATAPGSVAQDGTGRNGLYTKYLLQYMREPGLKVEDVMKKVRQAVVTESQGKQTPWDSSSLIGDFYFVPSPATK